MGFFGGWCCPSIRHPSIAPLSLPCFFTSQNPFFFHPILLITTVLRGLIWRRVGAELVRIWCGLTEGRSGRSGRSGTCRGGHSQRVGMSGRSGACRGGRGGGREVPCVHAPFGGWSGACREREPTHHTNTEQQVVSEVRPLRGLVTCRQHSDNATASRWLGAIKVRIWCGQRAFFLYIQKKLYLCTRKIIDFRYGKEQKRTCKHG